MDMRSSCADASIAGAGAESGAGRGSMTRSPLARIELGEAMAFLVCFVAGFLLVTVFAMQKEA